MRPLEGAEAVAEFECDELEIPKKEKAANEISGAYGTRVSSAFSAEIGSDDRTPIYWPCWPFNCNPHSSTIVCAVGLLFRQPTIGHHTLAGAASFVGDFAV